MRLTKMLWVLTLAPFLGGCSSLQACEEQESPAGYGQPQVGSATPFACALPAPCATANLIGGGNISLDPAKPTEGTFPDPAALACVLGALRDRQVSQVKFGHNVGGEFGYEETVFIVDGAHGVSNWNDYQDLGLRTGVRNRQILKPPSYFQGCLAITDPVKVYTCLASWSDGCADTAVSCPGS